MQYINIYIYNVVIVFNKFILVSLYSSIFFGLHEICNNKYAQQFLFQL